MVRQLTRGLLPALCCLIYLSPNGKQDVLQAEELRPASDTTSTPGVKGYRDIVIFKDRYFAVGSDGRIDCISQSGEKVTANSSTAYTLNCAYANEDILVVAGDHGTVSYSSDGRIFDHAETQTVENINGITSKAGTILAGADNGTILISNDGKVWNSIHTAAEGNIVSLSAGPSFFMGVTDVGEILKSSDGIQWEISDYNKEYAGYNKPAKFRKVLIANNSIVIIGTHDDGSPAILCSTLGNVWAERIPLYHDEHGMIKYLEQKPNGITYDPVMDEFVLSCDNGELFSLPSCSKCNKFLKVSDSNFKAVLYAGDCLLIAGDNYSFFIQKL